MRNKNTFALRTGIFLVGVAFAGCEKLPQPSPSSKAEATVAAAKPTYTAAQQAWLNFVDKVRRGEQVDPTGQYVKDGTIVPADAERLTRPKLDAARDQYPFRLRPDGTVVLVPKAASRNGGETNVPFPTEDPPVDCPPGGCTGVPVITSTFVSSVGLDGSGDIVDLKLAYESETPYGLYNYKKLNASLNSGAGGSTLYYYFTRVPAAVLQGEEYRKYPTLSMTVADPLVAYDTKTTNWFFQSTPSAEYGFFPIHFPSGNWETIDLNEGAGGKYIWSYQSKLPGVVPNAAPFHEVGILIGNSSSIQPPVGWQKWSQDLNEGTGGDYIYFCFRR